MPESGSQLYERERELTALDQALDAAAAGAPRLVLVEGPAGAGKSRLLAAARTRARARGLALLAAHGVELERAFPFGLARQLAEPLLAAADAQERERLLAGPAGLCASLFGLLGAGAGAAGGAAAPDTAAGGALLGDDRRLALAHGLRWLLANATRARPAVALVDDAHWGDAPSLAFLAALAARRDLPLTLIVALRPGEPGAPEQLDRLRATPGAVLLRPAPLGRDGAAQLLAARLPQAEPAFADACAVASGGNPFLLVELVEAVAAGALEPTAAAAAQVAELVPETVLRATLLRLRALSPAAVALARAAAILGERATLRRARPSWPRSTSVDAADRGEREPPTRSPRPTCWRPASRCGSSTRSPPRRCGPSCRRMRGRGCTRAPPRCSRATASSRRRSRPSCCTRRRAAGRRPGRCSSRPPAPPCATATARPAAACSRGRWRSR